MALSKGKVKLAVKAVKKFTDREEPKASFSKALDGLYDGTRPFSVLMYYGIGGIGKTSLLRHLYQNLPDDKFTVVFINLEASAYSSIADILMDMRRSIHGNFPIFEYALVRYLARQGRSLKNVISTGLPDDSLLIDFIEVASDLAEVVAPARLIKRLFEIGHEKILRILPIYKSKFDEIDQLPDDQLEEMLPIYLGMEMELLFAKASRKLVVFLDTHEASQWRSVFRSTKHGGDEWLRELIGATESGLFVIAGRERLKWVDHNPEWEAVMEQHFLGKLADSDANDFLMSVNITEKQFRDAIINTAGGVPLYLDLCAETYLVRKQSGQVLSPSDFSMHTNQVIERFLAHLDRDWAQAIRITAIANVFDFELFCELLQGFNIQFPASLYVDFCDSSFVVNVHDRNEVFMVHDIVKEYVNNEIGQVIALRTLDCMLKSAEISIGDYNMFRASWIFEQSFALACKFRCLLSKNAIWRILNIALLLIDSGLWGSVLQTLSINSINEKSISENALFKAIVVFLQAYCYRKTGRLIEARLMFDEAIKMKSMYMEYKLMLDFYSAHVSHLLGDFDTATQEYTKIVNTKCNSDKETYAQKLAQRQLCDVLMIRGKFRTAAIGFHALESEYPDPLWLAETYRFEGHVSRFNTRYDDAYKIYKNAKEIAESVKADSMLGKTLTNIAETLWWHSPEISLEIADEAIEINSAVQAPIEVGKALAAKSLALCFLHRYDEAIFWAHKSKETQLKNGYINGTLYALQAEGLSLHFLNQKKDLNFIIQQMKQTSEKIGVYGFLHLPLWLSVDPESALKAYPLYEWLDIDEVIDNHKGLLGMIK
jgi:tetratricopeptide (TPR) repeat protein/Cdc6-like AAA superfamily ATPase